MKLSFNNNFMTVYIAIRNQNVQRIFAILINLTDRKNKYLIFVKGMSKKWSDILKLGKYELKNRIVLCALTRVRCELDGVPTDLVAQYYGQRAGAGLMLTQAASICQRGIGYPGQANIYTKEQVQGWKKVLKNIHEKGSHLFVQLFHAGRVTHPAFNGGLQPWAPSAINTRQKITPLLQSQHTDYPVPKAVTLQDIQTLKQQYQTAFLLAKEAGFDGIQLHGANGYLIDQFLRSYTNNRTDQYGGSAQNRARFVLQITDIALKHFQPYQIGFKFTPTSRIQDMFDENPVQTYGYLLKQLSKRKIGFVELGECANQHSYGARTLHPITPKQQIEEVCKTFRPYFDGLIIGNYGFTPETGIKAIEEGKCDAVSFGRFYISHPDLAERILKGVELDNKLDFSTLYWDKVRDKSVGYTDYPFYKEK